MKSSSYGIFQKKFNIYILVKKELSDLKNLIAPFFYKIVRLVTEFRIIPTLFRHSHKGYSNSTLSHFQSIIKALFFELFYLSSLVLQKVLQLLQKNKSARGFCRFTVKNLVLFDAKFFYALFSFFRRKVNTKSPVERRKSETQR
jgi:hypothetical protein